MKLAVIGVIRNHNTYLHSCYLFNACGGGLVSVYVVTGSVCLLNSGLINITLVWTVMDLVETWYLHRV